ncbi:tRNA (cytidine32/uridine32-2'-O)-methyltransferase [Abyssogena phaseoliformis symbiont OG214]|uniref:RNA methyltransferase n=1 Tax=Abyssogena phaseoliformis symbiont TaxID=596095 RepID=UPI001915384A|nr:RNA methyltransferase [Abyssogena phaseoliformis symbiont]MBW5289203.1 tRNA:Cm32/Um32 methyltransferase [Candidatus Ruthia sp. Apha_13_S6]BBB22767.1 tRNA (cytidine32/uridine32-2'-O)-methyltransferase [Abyssogena phaseoliformis symbiont OG214]
MKKEIDYTFDNVRVVMVNTTESGNIGAAARAMKNMSLSRLYLVNPKGYPSATATARASGADDVLSNAVVCESLEEALKGVHLVIGASARQRNIKWRQMDVVNACSEIQKTIMVDSQKVAVIFGTERAGLTNKELDLCQILMTIPGNPNYFSLNVASAVQVFAYQNYVYNTTTKFEKSANELASFNELESFYAHLVQVLEHIEYFEDKRPKALLMRRLRRFFTKAEPEKEEVAIFRGILRNIKPFKKAAKNKF